MTVRGELIKLESGGHLAYDEYGDPNGVPVLFCHGWPSSRSMAQLTDDAAKKIGVRIISPDRPGINGSSFARDRKLLDWPNAARAVLSHLGLRKVRLLAVSGGAPYACAMAWAMPENVAAVAIVSGAPPIAELQNHADLLRLYRWMLAVHSRQPGFLRTMFRLARPFAAVKLPLQLRPFVLLTLQRMDAEVLRDSAAFESCFESSRQAWRTSVEGIIADAEIYAQPWGFPLEEIRVPVRLWHGMKDRTFSYRLAEWLAPRFQDCRLQLVENAGHYSLPIRHMEKILADLIQAGSTTNDNFRANAHG